MFTQLLFLYLIIILSAVFHEYAHGWAAFQLGDKTAYHAGRLTLNPLAHIDPIGTVLVPLFLMFTSGIFIGWAKPVPYNPYLLTDQRYGSLKVALAGPAANFIIALILGLFLRLFGADLVMSGFVSGTFLDLLQLIVYVNIVLALFNLIPIPPLDGSKIVFDLWPGYARLTNNLGIFGIFLALFLGFMILSPLASFLFSLIVGFAPLV